MSILLRNLWNTSSRHVHEPVPSGPDFDNHRVPRLSRAADPGGFAEWCSTLRHALQGGVGQTRRGGGVRWYGHLEGELPIPELPRGGDRPVHRVQAGANLCETAARLRPDEHVLVSGSLRVDLDSRDRVVQPCAHGAVRVMVERVHVWILKARVRLLAVPALPDRRRALLDRVEPGRVLLAQQQGVGVVEMNARQSPKWKPESRIRSSPASRRMYSTHARMLSYCDSRMRVSPYARYTVHGMITLASAQPVEPPPSAWPRDSTSGITWGTLPLAFWSAARSASHFVKKPATSKL